MVIKTFWNNFFSWAGFVARFLCFLKKKGSDVFSNFLEQPAILLQPQLELYWPGLAIPSVFVPL